MRQLHCKPHSKTWSRIQTESSLWNTPQSGLLSSANMAWKNLECYVGGWAPWVPGPLTISFPLENNHLPTASSVSCNPFPLACSSVRICVTHVFLGTAHQMLNLVKSNCYRKVYEQDSKNHSTHHRVQLPWAPPIWDLCNATDLRMVLNGPLFLPTLSIGPHPHPGPALCHLLSLTFPPLAIKLNFQAEELKLCFSPAHGPF